MIYKAIVETSINEHQAIVRIPLIHRTNASIEHTPTSELPVACISSLAGCLSPVQPGDVVIIGLENNDFDRPVILGHLSRAEIHKTLAAINATDITSTVSATLPANTTIGNINSTEISHLQGSEDNIQKQLDYLKEKLQVLETKLESANLIITQLAAAIDYII